MKQKPPSAKALREKYTFVKSWSHNHIIFLKIGAQSFIIGVPFDTKSEVEWFRRMLGKALHKLVSENR
jgi:hypothetical protein